MASFFEMAVQDQSKIKFHSLYSGAWTQNCSCLSIFWHIFSSSFLFFRLVQSYKKHYLQEISLIKYWFIYLTWTIITHFGLWFHTYCMIEMYVNQPFLHIFDPSDVVFSLLDWCVQILGDECDTMRLIPVLGQSYSPVMRSSCIYNLIDLVVKEANKAKAKTGKWTASIWFWPSASSSFSWHLIRIDYRINIQVDQCLVIILR